METLEEKRATGEFARSNKISEPGKVRLTRAPLEIYRPIQKESDWKPATAPAEATTQRNPPTIACAVRKVRGIDPLKTKNEKKRTDKREVHEALLGDPIPRLPRLAWPPAFPPRPHLLPFSRPPTVPQNAKGASPGEGFSEVLGCSPGCSPPTLPLAPHAIWDSCSAVRRETWSSSARGKPAPVVPSFLDLLEINRGAPVACPDLSGRPSNGVLCLVHAVFL
jgi:hypothetical protein